jgi:hypothetical protein
VVEIEKSDAALSRLLIRFAEDGRFRTANRPARCSNDLRADVGQVWPAHRRRPNRHPYFDDGLNGISLTRERCPRLPRPCGLPSK